MSLEIAIQENTKAVQALTAALLASKAPEAPAAVEPAATPAPKKAKAPKAEEPAATPAPEPVAEVSAPAAPVAEEKPVTLADLQAEGKKLLDAGKTAELKKVVSDLKGTKLSLLPASDYPAALKALKALTAAL